MDNSRELSEIIRKDSYSIESAFMIFNQMNEVRNDLFKEFISDLNASFINHPYSIETSDGDLSKRGANFYIPLSPGDDANLLI